MDLGTAAATIGTQFRASVPAAVEVIRQWRASARCALAIVGCGLALSACGSLPPAQARTSVNAAPIDWTTPLAKIAKASTPPGEHSGFRLMPLGIYSLDARLQLAKRATDTLIVQYYQLEVDGSGRLLLAALRDAASRGVKVRVLVDDLYTSQSEQPLLALSRIPNIEVRLFNPFCCGRSGFISRFMASPHEVVRLNHRMHNKLFIADGVMAVIGGRNIADEYFLLSKSQNFIDMDALVIGQVLPQLVASFDAFWNSQQVWPIADIVKSVRGAPPTAEEFDRWMGTRESAPPLALPRSDLLGYGPLTEELDDGRIGLVWGDAQAIADPPSKPQTMSAKEALADSVTMRVWRLILRADVEVALTSPYLVPGERGMEIIDELSRRNVRVTLLTNSLAANDEPLVHTGYVRYRRRILAGGAELYELSPARTSANVRFGEFGKSLGRLHAKSLTIDQRRVFIGSMNLDPRSATQNTEMGVVVDSPELAQEVLRVVEISKRRNAYRLRIDAATDVLEWLIFEDEKEIVLRSEPETSYFHRLYIHLVAPFVPESLL